MPPPKKIPKALHHYFWDVDVKKLDPAEKPYFVISRLLDKGRLDAVRWVLRNYSKATIKQSFVRLRDFTARTGSFWSLFLQIPKDKILCLQPQYLKMRASHWPY